MITKEEIEELKRRIFDKFDFVDANGDYLDFPDPLTYVSPEGDTALHLAVFKDDVHAVRLLIQAGADVNAAGDFDDTPLHVANRRNVTEIVGLLIGAGADVAAKNMFGDEAGGSTGDRPDASSILPS